MLETPEDIIAAIVYSLVIVTAFGLAVCNFYKACKEKYPLMSLIYYIASFLFLLIGLFYVRILLNLFY